MTRGTDDASREGRGAPIAVRPGAGSLGRRLPRRGATALLATAVLALACATSTPPPPPPAPPAPAADAAPVPEPPPPPPAPPPIDVQEELAAAAAARDAGDLAAARAHLEAAVGAAPKLFDPRLDLAELLLAHGADLPEVAELLREARLLGGSQPRLETLEGELREAEGDLPAAVDAYARALATRPDPDVALRRGVLLRRLGRGGEAIAAFEAVRAARPRDRVARANLAELYEERGRAADADRELTALARAAPDDPGPLRALAAFYRRRGDLRAARRAEADAARIERGPRALRPLRPSR